MTQKKIIEELERGLKKGETQVDSQHYVDMSDTTSFVERRFDDQVNNNIINNKGIKTVQRFVCDIHTEAKWYWEAEREEEEEWKDNSKVKKKAQGLRSTSIVFFSSLFLFVFLSFNFIPKLRKGVVVTVC